MQAMIKTQFWKFLSNKAYNSFSGKNCKVDLNAWGSISFTSTNNQKLLQHCFLTLKILIAQINCPALDFTKTDNIFPSIFMCPGQRSHWQSNKHVLPLSRLINFFRGNFRYHCYLHPKLLKHKSVLENC